MSKPRSHFAHVGAPPAGAHVPDRATSEVEIVRENLENHAPLIAMNLGDNFRDDPRFTDIVNMGLNGTIWTREALVNYFKQRSP